MMPESIDYVLVTLKKEMKRRGITQQQLGERLGWQANAVSRLLSGKHQPMFSTLEQVAEELGMELSVSLSHAGSKSSVIPAEPSRLG
jgi:transcriptional regulator with XRE-family HTH domain